MAGAACSSLLKSNRFFVVEGKRGHALVSSAVLKRHVDGLVGSLVKDEAEGNEAEAVVHKSLKQVLVFVLGLL